jgi:hypothetical protein
MGLGLPASAALLLWGVPGLFHPFHPDFGWGAALVFCGMGVFILLMAIAALRGVLREKKGPIRTSTSVSVFLIVLGLPASVASLLFGMACVADLINPELGVVAGLMFCGLGVFLLIMAIAAFRGILHRNKCSVGEHQA